MVSAVGQIVEGDAFHILHHRVRWKTVDALGLGVEYIGNRDGSSDQPNEIDFLLAEGWIVLVNADHNPMGAGVETELEIRVPKTVGERVDLQDAALAKRGADEVLQGGRGESAARAPDGSTLPRAGRRES